MARSKRAKTREVSEVEVEEWIALDMARSKRAKTREVSEVEVEEYDSTEEEEVPEGEEDVLVSKRSSGKCSTKTPLEEVFEFEEYDSTEESEEEGIPLTEEEEELDGEEEVLWFGDRSSTDVLVLLIPRSIASESTQESAQTREKPRRPTTIHMHLKTLQRARYFSSVMPSKCKGFPLSYSMSIENRDATLYYIRCLELLYCEEIFPTHFKDVNDAFATLKVAFRIFFQECIDPCMCYLAGVSWSTKEERAIRSFFSESNAPPPSQDLADRLGISEHYSTPKIEEKMDSTLVYLVELASSDIHSDTGRKALEVLLKEKVGRRGSSSIPLPKSAQMALKYKWAEALEEFKECVDVLSMQECLPSLLWYFHTLLDCNIGSDAVEVLASDEQLVKLLASVGLPECQALIDLLLRVFRMVAVGLVVLPNSIRFALVKSWLGHFQDLQITLHYCKPDFGTIGNWLNDLIKTLPLFDQVEIFKSYWAYETHKGVSKWPDLQGAFAEWCAKLGSALDREQVNKNATQAAAVPSREKKRKMQSHNENCSGVPPDRVERKVAKFKPYVVEREKPYVGRRRIIEPSKIL